MYLLNEIKMPCLFEKYWVEKLSRLDLNQEYDFKIAPLQKHKAAFKLFCFKCYQIILFSAFQNEGKKKHISIKQSIIKLESTRLAHTS